MDQIGNIINKRLNQHKIGDSARASEILYKANQYLSQWLKCEAEDVRAVTLKDGVLSIKVGSAVWGQETWGVKTNLLKKIQDEYGKDSVKKIVTRS